MSVRELRHDRPSGRFSKSWGLSASVSFLSSPSPPRSFTYAIFRAFFDSRSSFFVACVASVSVWWEALRFKRGQRSWRANLADQNKQQPLKINIRVTYHTVLSVWNKPLIDTCQHCSTNRANQAPRLLANAGFQNRGVCLQAFPSFPSPSPHFHFLALVSFLARSKPRIPFLRLSLLRNQTETLATQATFFTPKPHGNACYAGYPICCRTIVTYD